MSLRQKLLQAIERDPKNAADLAEELDIDRKVVQDNISAAIKEGLAERKIEDGKPIYLITAKGRTRLGNPNSKLSDRPASGDAAQPEVAQNTGSSAPANSSDIPAGGAAPIIYTAETAEITQELAMALDLVKELRARIDEQASTIDNLRIECNNLEHRSILRDELTLAEMIKQLGEIIGKDFCLMIEQGSNPSLIEKVTEDEYVVHPDEIYSFIEAMRFIFERKAA